MARREIRRESSGGCVHRLQPARADRSGEDTEHGKGDMNSTPAPFVTQRFLAGCRLAREFTDRSRTAFGLPVLPAVLAGAQLALAARFSARVSLAFLTLFLVGSTNAAYATDEISGNRLPTGLTQESAEPQPSFTDLALAIKPGDWIRIEDQAGVRTTGRLTRLTPDEIRIEAAGSEKVLPRRDVRVVSRLQGSSRRGMLIGMGVMVPLLALSECRGGKNHYCGEGLEAGLVLGVGLGACAGALLPRSTTLYRAGKSEVRISPVLSRQAVGIGAHLSW